MTGMTILQGNVGSEIERSETPAGVPWVKFRFAHTPRTKREGEWTDDGTIWLTVQAWRGLADNISRSVRKGDALVVVGRLRPDSWVGADGRLREEQVIEAHAVGHDLNYGETMFRRRRRTSGAVRPGQPADDGESAERPAGDDVETEQSGEKDAADVPAAAA